MKSKKRDPLDPQNKKTKRNVPASDHCGHLGAMYKRSATNNLRDKDIDVHMASGNLHMHILTKQ